MLGLVGCNRNVFSSANAVLVVNNERSWLNQLSHISDLNRALPCLKRSNCHHIILCFKIQQPRCCRSSYYLKLRNCFCTRWIKMNPNSTNWSLTSSSSKGIGTGERFVTCGLIHRFPKNNAAVVIAVTSSAVRFVREIAAAMSKTRWKQCLKDGDNIASTIHSHRFLY